MSNKPKIVLTTPWGDVKYPSQVAPGILDFWLPKAMGWHLTAEWVAKMPEIARIGTPDELGGMYFIDHRWVLPALAFHAEAALSFRVWWPAIIEIVLARVVHAYIHPTPNDWLTPALRAWCFRQIADMQMWQQQGD